MLFTYISLDNNLNMYLKTLRKYISVVCRREEGYEFCSFMLCSVFSLSPTELELHVKCK